MSGHASTFRFDRAIVRCPSRSVVSGLRAIDRGDPVFESVASEHGAYVAALRNAGVDVAVLPATEQFPDSVFVEDPALVFPEGAVLLRPGTRTRIGEVKDLEVPLRAEFDTVLELPEPGFAEGGDILITPEMVMIGLSSRTDQAGAEGVQACLRELGRASEIVQTPAGVLHFKSDCSLLDHETILTTERLSQSGVFKNFDEVTVPRGEESAANALRVNDVVLLGSEFPKTIELLDGRGYTVVALPTTAIGRIDAGLSCMSLRWWAGDESSGVVSSRKGSAVED